MLGDRHAGEGSRAQSAIEYLMTYGWLLLIVAIVLAALFQLGIFNPTNFAPRVPPGSCTIFRPYGINTTEYITSEGICNGELPQFVGYMLQSRHSDILMHVRSTSPAYTVMFWIEPFNNGSTPQNVLYINGTSQGQAIYIYWLPDPAPPVEPWSMVSLTVNATSGVWHLYDNESVIQSGTISFSSISSIDLGGAHLSEGLYGFNARVANVQLYNSSFTNNEINASYIKGIGADPVNLLNLIGWWPLDSNAFDYSGDGGNSTVHNITYTTDWISAYQAPKN